MSTSIDNARFRPGAWRSETSPSPSQTRLCTPIEAGMPVTLFCAAAIAAYSRSWISNCHVSCRNY